MIVLTILKFFGDCFGCCVVLVSEEDGGRRAEATYEEMCDGHSTSAVVTDVEAVSEVDPQVDRVESNLSKTGSLLSAIDVLKTPVLTKA